MFVNNCKTCEQLTNWDSELFTAILNYAAYLSGNENGVELDP